MNKRNSSKLMIDASILTSIFIVLTLISNGLGLGFLGYYDFLVPVFFAIMFVKTNWKYSALSVVVSAVVLLFVLGNPISPIMVIQGAFLGIAVGVALTKFDCIGDEIVFTSVVSLFILFIFDFILRAFTNVSIVSNFGEFSKEMAQVINTAIEIAGEKGTNKEAISFLESYKSMIGSDFIKQVFYFNFGLMSFGNGFIVYFLSLILIKKLKLTIKEHSYKLNLVSSLKKNIRLIFSGRKSFMAMIIYILLAEILKAIKFETGLSYLDGIIYSLEYIFMIFTFKDAVVIVENKMIAESGSLKTVRLYRVFMIIALLVNAKLMYAAAIINYIINDKDGKYRNLFRKALENNLSQ